MILKVTIRRGGCFKIYNLIEPKCLNKCSDNRLMTKNFQINK